MVTLYGVELDELRHPRLAVKESVAYDEQIANNPEAVVTLMNKCFKLNRLAEEHMYMICFSAACETLGVFEISHGSAYGTLSGKREIFMRAILCGAVKFIVAHNHPSGHTNPSKMDRETAKGLKAFGEMMEIEMLDFIIVGGKDFLSFEREGMI